MMYALAGGLCASALPGNGLLARSLEQGVPMTVTKTPGCGCCTEWANLARKAGYAVREVMTDDYVAMKRAHGVPQHLASCHSARVAGYVVEGHVPFEALEKLLAERPGIHGLAVPGMPDGSPGMGDDPKARYDVIAFGGVAGAGQVYYRAGL